MEYIELKESEIDRQLFAHFIRRQIVTKCWRKADGKWCIRDIAFVDDWSEEDYGVLVRCLRNTVRTGGLVLGAFDKEELKGFVSVEAALIGKHKEYMDLTSIHVSEDARGQGIGRELFLAAKDWARAHGAQKLYISAHSAVESQAFYRRMGCVEAQEYQAAHVEAEPCDCQLECVL